MCGIIGYIGPKAAAPILIEGLKRLEYRGYDSAGPPMERSQILTLIPISILLKRLLLFITAL